MQNNSWDPKKIGAIAGLLGFFMGYAILQEKIMTTPYDVDAQGENVYFKDSASLVFNNRIVAILIAIGILLYQQESLGNVAPLYKYALISGSNFLATYSQYDALKYVSFPTQTLGKCGKMIAVMITGSFINQKTYSLNEYGIAAGITLGCVIFMMGGNIASKRTDHSDSVYGLVLMGVYLFSDSFTSTFQEKLFKDYKISTYNQMLYVNASSAAMSIFVLIGQGVLATALKMYVTYPALFLDALILSLCASLGQMLIYYTIKNYGALLFSTVMTTRQFVSVLLSSIIFLNPLTMAQWFGMIVVMSALYYEAFWKQQSRARHHQQQQLPVPQVLGKN